MTSTTFGLPNTSAFPISRNLKPDTVNRGKKIVLKVPGAIGQTMRKPITGILYVSIYKNFIKEIV